MPKNMTAILLGFIFSCIIWSAAQAQTAYVYLAKESELEDNQPYVRDERAYDRDFIIPSVQGAERILYRQTKDVNWYLFALSVTDEIPVLILILPDEGLTTAYLNGQPLSTDAPVEIELSETAELHVAANDKRQLIRLCFTNLPVFMFTYSGDLTTEDHEALLSIVDPDYLEHGLDNAVLTCDALLSRRGNSSLNYSEKRSYNFSLMQGGEKWDTSLMGLRKDSDWLLDASFSDASRMRNRVLMDVWDDIYSLPWNKTLSGATKGCYVEVFINGVYKGLYALGEKQDRKQLGLKSADDGGTGVIFRTTGTYSADGASPADFSSIGTQLPGSGDSILNWYNIEIKYPKAEYCTEETWAELYELTKLVVSGSDKEFAANIQAYTDLDNLADYYLFCNAMNLNDNMRKNMTFVCCDKMDERFSDLILLPWDMDASLGRAYSSLKTKSKTMTNRLFSRLIESNAGNFREILYARWQELKEGALSSAYVMSCFEKYYEALTRAGALEREMQAHPKFTSYLEGAYGFTLNVKKELAYIQQFLEAHLDYWDNEMNKLVQ